MIKVRVSLMLVILGVGLAGCSSQYSNFFTGSQNAQIPAEQQGLTATSVDKEGRERNVNITMTGGGEIGLRSMDDQDKKKMSRALDAATGKSTHWENGATGVAYTVTPIRKVVVQGNPFCREYSVLASRGSRSKTMGGTACVTSDGLWHTI